MRDNEELWLLIEALDQQTTPIRYLNSRRPSNTGGNCYVIEMLTADDRVVIVSHGMCDEGYEIGEYSDIAAWEDGDGTSLSMLMGVALAEAVTQIVRLMG